MTTEMYRITRGTHIVGTIRKSDLANHGAIPIRLRYELAQMVSGPIAQSILRGHVTEYSDGSYSVRPRNTKGYATDTRGNLISYWVTPYEFTV